MSTRNLIIGLLILAGITLLIINPSPTVNNQRALNESVPFQSRLETRSADETLDFKLNELITETKEESNSESTREVKVGDRISVHYRGWLAKDSSQVFDQSFNRGTPLTIIVGQGVIPGWSQGVIGMSIGEIRRLKIPSSLAYGENGNGSVIGPNEDLIFDVELVSFN